MNRFRWVAAGYGEILSVSSPLRTSHLYFKLAHEFYAPAQAVIQEKLDLIDNLVVKTDINLPTLSSRWDNVYAENIGWVKSEGQWLNGNTYHDAYELMVSRIGINDKFIAATVGTELTDENADKFLIDTAAVKFRLPLINGERVLVASSKTDTEWYNYYSDGWLEQGGEIPGGTETVTYPKDFIDTKYYFNRNSYGLSGESDAYNVYGGSGKSKNDTRTINSVTFNSSTKTVGHIWQAKGRARILSPIDYNRGLYLFFKLADEVPTTVVNTEQVIADLHEEAINFKNECSQTLAQGHFVIETWKEGTEWYRKYSDGWVEQGGVVTAPANSKVSSFYVPFIDTNYTLIASPRLAGGTFWNDPACASPETSSTFRYGAYNGNDSIKMTWYACGYMATNS